MKEKINHILRLATVALLLMAVAIQRDGRLLGTDISEIGSAKDTATTDVVSRQADGTIIVNTSELGKKIIGYGGPTPLIITVRDGIVEDIQAEKNNETPDFFNTAFEHLSKKWVGKTTGEIQSMSPDGVTGATMSSNALNQNMQLAMQQISENDTAYESASAPWSIARIAVLIVVAFGCVLPLFSWFKKYRTLWLCANVAVLGLWGGTFLSHALFVNWLSNGVNVIASLAVVLMLIAAFIYPLFGKKSYYCTWMCPLGALQDLTGKVNKNHKLRLSNNAVKRLSLFNELLWAILMLLMLTGVWFEWMDYELFSAFLFTAASPVVIALAIIFVVLSAFVPRPYCRFVCPTGCLFRMTQSSK